jgi:hypothetical protein
VHSAPLGIVLQQVDELGYLRIGDISKFLDERIDGDAPLVQGERERSNALAFGVGEVSGHLFQPVLATTWHVAGPSVTYFEDVASPRASPGVLSPATPLAPD